MYSRYTFCELSAVHTEALNDCKCLTPWYRSLLGKLILTHWDKKFSAFTDPERLLSCSQKPPIEPYSDAGGSNYIHTFYFSETFFNTALVYILNYPIWSLSFRCSGIEFVYVSHYPHP